MYHILIVDDEDMIKRSLRKIIETDFTGLNIAGEAVNGSEALQLTEKIRPDLIITDIKMPIMDGLELVEKVKAAYSRIEIILVTGYDDFAYARKALQYGAIDYLLKPIKRTEVRKALGNALHKIKSREEKNKLVWEWANRLQHSVLKLADALWRLDDEEIRTITLQLDDSCGLLKEQIAAQEIYAYLTDQLVHLVSSQLGQDVKKTDRSAETAASDRTDEEGFAELVRHLTGLIRVKRNWGRSKHVAKAIRYAEENYHKEFFSLQSVADELGVSLSYLSRSFKEEMGISFIDFLTEFRMNHAKLLLGDPDAKVSEVAYRLGYQEYTHFSRMFKKHVGMSPAEYKQSRSK